MFSEFLLALVRHPVLAHHLGVELDEFGGALQNHEPEMLRAHRERVVRCEGRGGRGDEAVAMGIAEHHGTIGVQELPPIVDEAPGALRVLLLPRRFGRGDSAAAIREITPAATTLGERGCCRPRCRGA